MTITAIARNFNGDPNIVTIVTPDTFDQITAEGYLELPENIADIAILQNGVFEWTPTDAVLISYSNSFGWFVMNPDLAKFTPTGTGSGVILPTQANFLASFRDIDGTLGMPTDSGVVNVNASILTTPGEGFSSQAPSGLGRISLFAQDAGGLFNLFINNTTMTQTTAMVIPNVTGASGTFLCATGVTPFVAGNFPICTGSDGRMADSGAHIFSGTTGTFAGGGTTNNFSIPGITSTSVGSCVIKTSTNNAFIAKAVAASGTLNVTFSTDPGAGTTLTYMYTTNPII